MAESKKTATVRFPAPLSKSEPNYELVGWNGKMFKIKKGEDVEVPIEVAEIIKNSQIQKDENAKRLLGQTV